MKLEAICKKWKELKRIDPLTSSYSSVDSFLQHVMIISIIIPTKVQICKQIDAILMIIDSESIDSIFRSIPYVLEHIKSVWIIP